MQTKSVTSQVQITNLKTIRKQLEIFQGCQIHPPLINKSIELRLCQATTAEQAISGFAMLKSNCVAVLADFDAACLLTERQNSNSV